MKMIKTTEQEEHLHVNNREYAMDNDNDNLYDIMMINHVTIFVNKSQLLFISIIS